MQITINIPSTLRRFVDNKPKIEESAATLGEALEALADNYPRLYPQIFSESGDIRRFVKIFVNNKAVDSLMSYKIRLNLGDEITLMPAVAGG